MLAGVVVLTLAGCRAPAALTTADDAWRLLRVACAPATDAAALAPADLDAGAGPAPSACTLAAMQLAISRLEDAAATSDAPAAWHRAGVAALYGGDVDRAVTWIERAAAAGGAEGPEQPTYWRDLAAARLARARAEGGDADVLRALDAAAAAGRDGEDLVTQAERQLALPPPGAIPRETRVTGLAARDALESGVDLTNADEAAEVVERHWLRQWATAVMRDDGTAARAWATRARAAAGAVRAAGGDTSLLSLVDELTASPQPATTRAGGWLAYLEASEAFDGDDMTRAGRAAGRMRQPLAEAGPVASIRATFLQAAIDRVAGAVTPATRTLDDGRAPVFRAHAVVEARRQAWVGLRSIEGGRPGAGERTLERAAATFAAAGTAEAEALVLNSLTRRAADRQEWDRAVRSQRRANELLVRSARLRRDLIRRTGAFVASAMGLRHAALAIRGPAIAEARVAGASARLAFMLADEAVDFHQSGDVPRALAALDEAERYAATVADAGLRDMIAVLHHRTRAGVLSERDPAAAAALFGEALRLYRRRGSEFDTADLLLRRGRLLRRLGRDRDAEAALRDGLTVARAEVGSHQTRAAARLRDVRWALARELATLLVGRGDRWAAYDVVSEARAQPAAATARRAGRVPASTLRLTIVRLDDRFSAFARWADGRLAYDVALEAGAVGRAIDAVRAAAREGRPDVAAGTTLAEALFGPVRTALKGAVHLTICADDSFVAVPYAVLPDPEGGRIVDRRAVALATSCEFETGGDVPARNPAALVAGAADRTAATEAAPDLPRARDEVAGVAALYPQAGVMIGADLTREAILTRLPATSLFHFAGHAVAHPSRSDLSRLLVAPSADNPQGTVLASEIESLRVRGALVVLAACDTATGAPAPGAGVAGLARAFLTAGARTVVATQWPVPDHDATRFFVEIHRRLAVSRSISEAVRAAQLWADGQGISPAVWAAAVVVHG